MHVHLYAMCLNEARMIPYFLAHYGGWVDRFHIFDNGSTDASLQLLAGDPRIVVERFATGTEGFVETARRLMNEAWQRSRAADWVVTAEMDEHLHHPCLPEYLRACAAQDVTAIRAIGFDMVAQGFPSGERPLCEQVARGVRSIGYDKLAIFDPRAIVASGYGAGRHDAEPTGRVRWELHRQVKLLHFKNLGADYVNARNNVLAGGLRAADDATGSGRHYRRTPQQVAANLGELLGLARRVPGLSAPGCPADEPGWEEEVAIVRHSGLLDLAWYGRKNPDVVAGGGDFVEHFCGYGAREGRWPNAFFDPAWYAATYRPDGPGRRNALLDYILDGEGRGRLPSPGFDPAIHRMMHRLRPDESALRHALGTTSG